MNRTIMGFLWFLAFYLGASFSLGVIVGLTNPNNAEQKADDLGESLGFPILLMSAGGAIYGTTNRRLP